MFSWGLTCMGETTGQLKLMMMILIPPAPLSQLTGPAGEWKIHNTWLFVKDREFGCTVYRCAKTLLLSEKLIGTCLSDVSKAAQIRLRKEIYKHCDCIAHKRSVIPSKNRFCQITSLNSKLYKETAILLSSTYMVKEGPLSNLIYIQ